MSATTSPADTHQSHISKVDYCSSVLVGVSGLLLDRLQSVLNAATRLIFSARRSEHITPLLRDLHWLRVPERIWFCLCVLTHRCLNGTALFYLTDSICQVAHVEGCCQLHSSATRTLLVPPVRWSTLGDRSFPVAVPQTWNSLPSAVRTALSLITFQRQLNTFLYTTCGLLVTNARFSLLPISYWLCKVPLQRVSWQCHSVHL